ncbi:unnamed protein product [Pocillopora meandrina]|uniref:Shavenoid isoform B-like N-terminal domain-containing protein n=1 Tax=Pocillopora meandrina TaxID=46732 RepID=A0AAU9W3B3_9CNID|nr:unnamed protein product [Pocillopora meandrina]
MPSTTAVTLNSFIRIVVLMFCLASHHFVPIQSTLRADGVEKYVITRSERTDNDVFKIIYKTGFKCPQDVCENSSAWVNNTAQCTCSCKADTATFLPLIGSCGDTASIKTSLFGICSRFFEWPFFLKSLDLSNEGGVEIGSDVNYQACQVVPGRTAYLDYQLENKWARVYPEIFKVERVQGKLVFKWVNNGTDKILSGRIVRVVINCSYSASASRPPKTACLIFKSSGQITYVTDDLNDMSAPESDSSAKPGFVAKKTPHISPITKTTSVTESINDTGKNYGGKNGNYSGSVVVIGIAVGCALVFGILIIVLVVFCKRRKLETNQQETKSAVRNPVIENQKDREMEDVSTSSEQAGQSTYQSLVTNSGKLVRNNCYSLFLGGVHSHTFSNHNEIKEHLLFGKGSLF